MNNVSDRLTIEEYNGRQIIFVDYKGLKESEMIELINRHMELTLETKLPFLADFHNTYATPGYMIHARKFIESTKTIIDKGALVGIDPIKSWILKGLLYAYKVNYKSFETVDKAITFLTVDN
jgi:hypothetical protein